MGAQRLVSRHWHDEALQRMQQRATPEAMRLRGSTVEHPFATLKCHIFGHPRLLLRGRRGGNELGGDRLQLETYDKHSRSTPFGGRAGSSLNFRMSVFTPELFSVKSTKSDAPDSEHRSCF